MQKKLLIIVAVFCCSLVYCQTDSTTAPTQTDTTVATQKPAKKRKDTRPLKERLAFGLGTGFWITPSQTYIEVAPMLAYRFPKVLIAGIGYRYIYRHNRYNNSDLHSHGPNLFARANITKRIYLWTEYEILKSQSYDNGNNDVSTSTSTVDSWFVGIGYIRKVGRKGGVSMQVLYNLLYENNPQSPYYSAFTYRVGYFF